MTLSALVKPAYFTCPDYSVTLGPEVGELAALANFPPDPEQQLILDAMCALDKKGKSAAFEVAVICPRQNLKTGLLKIAAIGKTVVMERPLFVWSAHEFRTAQEAFRDMTILIESCPDLDQMVKKIHYGNGDESIEWLGGQRIMFKARTNAGGRGLTGDDVGLDEGFALTPSHMGALLPTLSARPDPQVLIASSAGLAQSEVLRRIRDRGRSGSSPRMVYIEWCSAQDSCTAGADCEHALGTDGCALDDEEKVHEANPALHRRITIEFIRAERQALPPREYARERHGWWDEPNGESAIPESKWAARFDSDAVVAGGQVFALDVSPKMTHAAIAVAGHGVGGIHTELLMREGQRELDYRPGTEWVLPGLLDLKTRVPNLTVVIAANGQAKSLVPDLKAAGIAVEEVSGPDVAAYCGLLYKLADQGGLTHSGQPELAQSVAAGQWRDTGEGAQVWGRRKSGEITGLYATTLAVGVAHRGIGLMHPINNIW